MNADDLSVQVTREIVIFIFLCLFFVHRDSSLCFHGLTIDHYSGEDNTYNPQFFS